MNSALEATIYLQCPILYRHRKAGQQTNLMHYGFAHGDGWYNIIYNTSIAIEEIARNMKANGSSEDQLPLAVQVKEKFGTLRFYVSNQNHEIGELIDKAESLSEVTCEQCGQPGRLINKGWYSTLCENCADKDEML